MKKRSLKIIISVVASVLAALIFELLIFKIPYFVTLSKSGDNYKNIDLQQVEVSSRVSTNEKGELVLGSGTSVITINGLDGSFDSLKLDISAPEDKYAEIKIEFCEKDDNNPRFRSLDGIKFSPYDKESAFFELPDVEITSLKLSFSASCNMANIKSIELDAKPYYELSFYRFSIVTIVFLAISATFVFKLYNKNYDHSNKLHKTLVLLVIIILLLVSTFVSTFNGAYTVEYPTKDDRYAYGNYVLQLEAFVKGQIHLDIEAPPRFELLENPFSPEERREHNIDTKWIWDKAYYNGKFYSYFGVVPVVLVYFPIYLLTGRVATDPLCCFIFSIIGIVCSVLFLRELVLRYLKKVNLLLMLLVMGSIPFAGMILPLQASANFYTVAVLSSLCTISAFMFFAFRGVREEVTFKRCIYFFFAGVFLALTVGCRPTSALYGAIALPALFAVLAEKQTTVKSKVTMVTTFVMPLFFIVGALLYYNSLRFSGPLDFGNNYQITLADVSTYKIKLSYLFEAFFHYFLQPAAIHNWFPFFGLSRVSLGTYEGYCYIGENIGAFSFLSNISLLCVFKERKKLSLENFFLLLIGVVLVCSLALMNMCLAGTHIRYVSDILLIITVLSGFTMLRLEGGKKSYWKTGFFSVLLISSIIVASALIFDNEVDLITKNTPSILLEFQRMF